MCALSKGLQQVCRLRVYTAAVQMRYALYLGARSHSMMVIKLIQATFALAVESLPSFPAPPPPLLSLTFPSISLSSMSRREPPSCSLVWSHAPCWERLPWPGEQGHAYLGSPVSLWPRSSAGDRWCLMALSEVTWLFSCPRSSAVRPWPDPPSSCWGNRCQAWE